MTTNIYEFQFNFHFNASSSLTSIKALGFFQLTYLVFTHLTYSIPHCLYYKISKAFIYKPEEYFVVISICIVHLLRYKIIILSYKVVSLVISIGQGII